MSERSVTGGRSGGMVERALIDGHTGFIHETGALRVRVVALSALRGRWFTRERGAVHTAPSAAAGPIVTAKETP